MTRLATRLEAAVRGTALAEPAKDLAGLISLGWQEQDSSLDPVELGP